MKNLKMLSFLIPALALALFTTACGGNADGSQSGSTNEQTEANSDADKQGPEYTSAYICPMHCDGSGSDKPGECPVCGMDYVKNEDMPAGDHQHEDGHNHDHEGHNH